MNLAKFLVVSAVIALTFGSGCTGSSDQRPLEIRDGAELTDFFLLDVRTRSEFDQGHLKNAYHIPYTDLQERIEEIPRDREIIVYCRTGRRSGMAEQTLRSNGFDRVTNGGGYNDLVKLSEG